MVRSVGGGAEFGEWMAEERGSEGGRWVGGGVGVGGGRGGRGRVGRKRGDKVAATF